MSGFGLMALKYGAETLLIHSVTGRWLTPLDYLNPLLSAREAVLGQHDWLVWPLVAWTLPFLWVGVSMTLRRAEDAGILPFVALFYFFPYVNYALMLALCLWPAAQQVGTEQLEVAQAESGDALRSALLGVLSGVAIALAMVGLSVWLFGSYGTTLFVATPFVMGAASAFLFNRRARRPLGATLLVSVATVMIAGGAILLFALEGVLCLLMAGPIGFTMATMGAILGRAVALRGKIQPRGLAAIALQLPLFAGAEAARLPQGPLEVLTRIEISAPPEAVWSRVVEFSEIPEPPALVLRLGIAYPERASIRGRGVGALRRCEFSTGAFQEPITVWDEPRRLAFDVRAQPPALKELSPYRHVLARHLDGYLNVRRGEFRLIPLPSGRTRLEGRTFYELRVYPAAYWSFFSDALIHVIHRRVLEHIKALAESS